MVFNIPDTQQEVIDRSSTDVQNELPTANPFLKNSFMRALIVAFSGRVFDFYIQFNILIRELFLDTATNSFLERWGSYKNITRNPATQADGDITATGTPASSIPIATLLQSSDGNQYQSTATVGIATTVLSVSTLTRSGSVVTATTVSDHMLGSSIDVVIAGAVETDYNGTFSITVTAADEFTYEIETTPTTPATGTITATADIATVNVQSVGFGNAQNLANGTQLTFSSPIAGVDDTAVVQFTEIAGGTDIESDDDLRNRIIDRYQNPISQFSVNAIVAKAKEVPGVTRVFVFESGDLFGDPTSITSITRDGQVATAVFATDHNLEPCMNITVSGADQTEYNGEHRVLIVDNVTVSYIVSGTPTTPATGTITGVGSVALGQVVIFFTRDNDVSIIPTAQEVDDVKDKLQEIRPANTSNTDMIVNAPLPVTVPFTFTGLVPNTTTMQNAVTANLEALFREDTSVGVDLKSFSYESAIFQTIDPETGDKVQDFTLSTPTGDIAVAIDEIPVLGTITYP